MLKRLKNKIWGSFMLFAAVIVIIAMCVVSFTSIRSNATINERMLEQVLRNGKPSTSPFDPSSLFYFTVEVLPSGVARVSGNNVPDLDEAALIDLVKETLNLEKDSGILKSYDLRYYRLKTPFSTNIAYMSSKNEQQLAQKVILSSVFIGLGALALLTVISFFLSKMAIKPTEKAWKEQQQFISDASHELKTPLTVILSSADLLKEDSDEKNLPYVENIQAEGRRMKQLVEGMLTLTRIENKTASLSDVDFSDVVTDAVLRFEPVAFESGHEIRSNIADNLHLQGDANRLSQLCGIFIDNAIKYADANTPIDVSLRKLGKNAELAVTNTCPAIDKEKCDHLFDRFYRADESRSSTEGFGLGLPIAQEIAVSHKGKIRCESGEVTKFIATIPM